ncbi:MAG: hypothetical protein LBQ68_05655, partial [Clostridiales bacterium]|nr:hypothetical protein [Clostridiales bacterium]
SSDLDVAEAEMSRIDIYERFSMTVIGESRTGKTEFLSTVILTAQSILNWDVYVIDNNDNSLFELCRKFLGKSSSVRYANKPDDMDKMVEDIRTILVARKKTFWAEQDSQGEQFDAKSFIKQFDPLVIIIDDFENFFDKASEQSLNDFAQIIKNCNDTGAMFIVSANSQSIKRYMNSPAYGAVFTGRYGLLLGGAAGSQNVYNLNMTYQQASVTYEAGQGYLIDNGLCTVIRTQRP